MAAEETGERAAGEARARRMEWVAAALSGALILALFGHLLHAALSTEATPPELAVVLEPAGERLVTFRVENRGGRSASAVALSVQVGAAPVRRLVLDYVAGGSEVTGALPVAPGETANAWIEGWVDP